MFRVLLLHTPISPLFRGESTPCTPAIGDSIYGVPIANHSTFVAVVDNAVAVPAPMP